MTYTPSGPYAGPPDSPVRYGAYPGRPDLAMCLDCSTRTSGVGIPRDEIAAHDGQHAEWDAEQANIAKWDEGNR